MNKQHITLRIVKTYGEPFDCEDCGTCHPEGLYVAYDGVVVWEKFSDGHYSGHQTEMSILNAILEKWYNDMQSLHEVEKSEQNRLHWNRNHPGNAVARTPESWKEHQNECFSFITESVANIKENCENLPYNETLQVKMIALWFEEETGQVFNIEVDTEEYKN